MPVGRSSSRFSADAAVVFGQVWFGDHRQHPVELFALALAPPALGVVGQVVPGGFRNTETGVVTHMATDTTLISPKGLLFVCGESDDNGQN